MADYMKPAEPRVKHLIGAGGYCVNCQETVIRWDDECTPIVREVRTPFHGKPNEPITFRPDEVPKT